MNKRWLLLIYAFIQITAEAFAQNRTVVFQTDFGLKDGAVAAMKGVALSVSPDLKLFDLTHEIPAYNIWEAAYRLVQTAPYWPVGTVFVSVVDPGVGTKRKSIVLKTTTGHFFVGPDNGSFTLVAESMGIAEVRQIDEATNRRANSQQSYTFHGRDVYAYTAARLAAGVIDLAQVGPALPKEVVRIAYQKPIFERGVIKGNITILDVQYGNVWTNVDKKTFESLKLPAGRQLTVRIYDRQKLVYQGKMPLVDTFGGVKEGQPLAYFNSLMNLSFALNMGDFAKKMGVGSGPNWRVEVSQ